MSKISKIFGIKKKKQGKSVALILHYSGLVIVGGCLLPPCLCVCVFGGGGGGDLRTPNTSVLGYDKRVPPGDEHVSSSPVSLAYLSVLPFPPSSPNFTIPLPSVCLSHLLIALILILARSLSLSPSVSFNYIFPSF